ncbi:MAG: transglutaminase domain-containing protein, partial [Lachnospiraceae bacterium]|nr:transglutaminase domain-containing protein [Lachnospiraceae bacterium]
AACMAVSGPAAVFAAEDLAGGEAVASEAVAEDAATEEAFAKEAVTEEAAAAEVTVGDDFSIEGFDAPYLDPLAPAHPLSESGEKLVGAGEDSEETPSVTVSNTQEFLAAFKNFMVQRQTPFEIIISANLSMANAQNELNALVAEIQRAIDEDAVAHTGNPCEGDYLRYHRGGYVPDVNPISINPDLTTQTVAVTVSAKFALDYYSTAEQEQAVTERLAEVMDELDLAGKSDYEKVKAIHDFICRNNSYDYGHFGDESYVTQFSAYGALIDGASVCQGYANLFYRMCLMAGVDARIVGGTAGNGEGSGPHAWNIVKIGDKYYFVDVTWDDPAVEGDPDYFNEDYFLKGWESFGDHELDEEYLTDAFAEAYPISYEDYERSYYDDYTDEEPSFVKASLLLGGQIGVNFFLKLPEIEGCDYEDSYMEFIVNGDAANAEVDAFDPESLSSDRRLFGFTCHVNSIQMADPIKAVFHYAANETEMTVELDDYTVEDYIVNLQNAEDVSVEAVGLAQALANYGYHAQLYLSDVRGWALGGADSKHVPVTCNTVDGFADEEIQEIATLLAPGSLIWARSSDMKKITFSLALDSNVSIHVFFEPVEGYDGDFTATVNGVESGAIKRTKGRYRIAIDGIDAGRLGDPYTIIATTTAGTTEMWISALDYVGACLQVSQNQLEKNALAAIYEYHKAAQAYNMSLPIPS